MNGALLSSRDMTWCTPSSVLDRVRRVDVIELDPCHGPSSIVGARRVYAEADDGLSRSWQGGLVYCNPPYGRAIKDWVAKCALEHLAGAEVIALVPSRTDTVWWHEAVAACASAICFWRGRLKFLGATQNALFPSAVIYYGPRVERFCQAFGDAGWIVKGGSL